MENEGVVPFRMNIKKGSKINILNNLESLQSLRKVELQEMSVIPSEVPKNV